MPLNPGSPYRFSATGSASALQINRTDAKVCTIADIRHFFSNPAALSALPIVIDR